MTTPNTDDTFTFDCLAYKRRVQEQMYEATKHMGPEEELAYYRTLAETGPLSDWWKAVQQQAKPKAAPQR